MGTCTALDLYWIRLKADGLEYRHAFRAVLEMMENKQHDEDCTRETMRKAVLGVLDRLGR